MARGVNKVILVGNTGDVPQMRAFPDGTAVMNLSLATSESWKDRQTGEQKDRTEWHRVVIMGKPAEVLAPMIGKGTKLYVEGQLQTRKWQNQQGQDQYTTEIVVRGFGGQVQLLDRNPNAVPPQGGQQYAPPATQQRQPAPVAQTAATPQPSGEWDQFDDDIPF